MRGIIIKPSTTTLTFGWDFAMWTLIFSRFLHDFLRSEETKHNLDRLANTANDPEGDLAVGVVFQAALKAGLLIQSVKFPDANPLDIGRPENLIKAVSHFQSD